MSERFSASVAGRFMSCTASADLDKVIPGWEPPIQDPDADTAANRGTLMHSLFAGVMDLPLADQKNFLKALEYVTEVQSRRRFKRLIEHNIEVDWLVKPSKTTADLVLYTKDELHVLDLKTGRIPVEAVGNRQLLFYAVTYAQFAPAAKSVSLHIVQPWADNCSEWTVTTEELSAFMDEARQAEKAIDSGQLTFSPGDHCLFCPANPHGRGGKGHPYCPELMDLYYPELVDLAAIERGDV